MAHKLYVEVYENFPHIRLPMKRFNFETLHYRDFCDFEFSSMRNPRNVVALMMICSMDLG